MQAGIFSGIPAWKENQPRGGALGPSVTSQDNIPTPQRLSGRAGGGTSPAADEGGCSAVQLNPSLPAEPELQGLVQPGA